MPHSPMLAAIKLGDVVYCVTQGAGTGVGKEIEKYIHHRVTNRNRIGYVDGVGYIKIISTKLHTFVLHGKQVNVEPYQILVPD